MSLGSEGSMRTEGWEKPCQPDFNTVPHDDLAHLIPVTSDYMHISCNSPQVVECLTITDISSADNLLDLSGYKQLSELVWQVRSSIWKVKVTCRLGEYVRTSGCCLCVLIQPTYHKDEHSCWTTTMVVF